MIIIVIVVVNTRKSFDGTVTCCQLLITHLVFNEILPQKSWLNGITYESILKLMFR